MNREEFIEALKELFSGGSLDDCRLDELVNEFYWDSFNRGARVEALEHKTEKRLKVEGLIPA